MMGEQSCLRSVSHGHCQKRTQRLTMPYTQSHVYKLLCPVFPTEVPHPWPCCFHCKTSPCYMEQQTED